MQNLTAEQEKINDTRYSFIFDVSVDYNNDRVIIEGINNKKLLYEVFRFSDGKLLSSSTNDIADLILSPRGTDDLGTIKQLREKCHALEKLFYAVIESPALPNAVIINYQ